MVGIVLALATGLVLTIMRDLSFLAIVATAALAAIVWFMLRAAIARSS
jgi:hypothetical protein